MVNILGAKKLISKNLFQLSCQLSFENRCHTGVCMHAWFLDIYLSLEWRLCRCSEARIYRDMS